MAANDTGIIRKFVPQDGGFVFFRSGERIARERRDTGGNIRIEGEIPDGIVRTYYEDENGNDTPAIFAEWNYKDGKLEGVSRIYQQDGQLEEEFNYSGGKLDKICKRYYENGHLSAESILENGNGHCIYFSIAENAILTVSRI